MKVYAIRHASFETTRSGFIQFLHHCSLSWKITPLYFFSWSFIYFGQNYPFQVKFFGLLSGWEKIIQISHVTFETTSQFFFKRKFFFFFNKSAKFQTFDCSGQISQNLYLIGYFCWQYINVSWYWRVVQNLIKKQFFVSKMTRIWLILIWAVKSLKNLDFHWSFLCKVYNVWPKKLQRS